MSLWWLKKRRSGGGVVVVDCWRGWGVEGGGEPLGIGPDGVGEAGEVLLGPGVADRGGHGIGLADEAGGAGAVGDPGGQAEVHGQVEDLLGGDAQAGA